MEYMSDTKGFKYDDLILLVNTSIQDDLESTGCDLVKSILSFCLLLLF